MTQTTHCVSLWVYAAPKDDIQLILAIKRWFKSNARELAINGVAYRPIDRTPREGREIERKAVAPLVEIVVTSLSQDRVLYGAHFLLGKLREHKFNADLGENQNERHEQISKTAQAKQQSVPTMRRAPQEILKPAVERITARYTRICRLIFENDGPATNSQLRDTMGLTRSGMSSALRALISKGFVYESHRESVSAGGLATVYYLLSGKGKKYVMSWLSAHNQPT
jgi:DNA-binding MarR family transcriptional regulator